VSTSSTDTASSTLVEQNTEDVFETVAQHSLFTARIGEGTESEMVLGEMVTGN
jgi:hypothetical protein